MVKKKVVKKKAAPKRKAVKKKAAPKKKATRKKGLSSGLDDTFELWLKQQVALLKKKR